MTRVPRRPLSTCFASPCRLLSNLANSTLTDCPKIPGHLSGHTMNREGRLGGRSATRAAPAPLPPGDKAIMMQPVTAAPGTARHHFVRGSRETVRPRAAGPDVHRMRITAAVRLCGRAMHRPVRAATNSLQPSGGAAGQRATDRGCRRRRSHPERRAGTRNSRSGRTARGDPPVRPGASPRRGR